eukprot:2428965-Lingulodinium_polyedra.AAC.1
MESGHLGLQQPGHGQPGAVEVPRDSLQAPIVRALVGKPPWEPAEPLEQTCHLLVAPGCLALGCLSGNALFEPAADPPCPLLKEDNGHIQRVIAGLGYWLAHVQAPSQHREEGTQPSHALAGASQEEAQRELVQGQRRPREVSRALQVLSCSFPERAGLAKQRLEEHIALVDLDLNPWA